jgi:hypothetical protein
MLSDFSQDEDFRTEFCDMDVSNGARRLATKLSAVSLPPTSDDLRSHRILKALTLGRQLPALCNVLFGTLHSNSYLAPNGRTLKCWMSAANSSPKSQLAKEVLFLLSPTGALSRILQQYSVPTPDSVFEWNGLQTPDSPSKPYEHYTFNFTVSLFSEESRKIISDCDGTVREVWKLPLVLQVPFYTPPLLTLNKSITEVPMCMWAYFCFRMATWLVNRTKATMQAVRRDDSEEFGYDIIDSFIRWMTPTGPTNVNRTGTAYVGLAPTSEVFGAIIKGFLETTMTKATYRQGDKISRADFHSLIVYHALREVWFSPLPYHQYESDRLILSPDATAVWHVQSAYPFLHKVLDRATTLGDSQYCNYIRLLRTLFLVNGLADVPLSKIPIARCLELWLSFIAHPTRGEGRGWHGWSYTTYVLQHYEMYSIPLDDFLYFLKSSQLLRVCDINLAQLVIKVLRVYTDPTLHDLLSYASTNCSTDPDIRHSLEENCGFVWKQTNKSDDKFIVCPMFSPLTAQRAAVVAMSLRNHLTPESSKKKNKAHLPLYAVLHDIHEILTNESVFPGVESCLASVAASPHRNVAKQEVQRRVTAATPLTLSESERLDVCKGRREGIDPMMQPTMYFPSRGSRVVHPEFLCGSDDIPILFTILMKLAWHMSNPKQEKKRAVKCPKGHGMQYAEHSGTCANCPTLKISWECPACSDKLCGTCAHADIVCTKGHPQYLAAPIGSTSLCPLCCTQVRGDEPMWKCDACGPGMCLQCNLRRPPSRTVLRWIHFISSTHGAVFIGALGALTFFIVFMMFVSYFLF